MPLGASGLVMLQRKRHAQENNAIHDKETADQRIERCLFKAYVLRHGKQAYSHHHYKGSARKGNSSKDGAIFISVVALHQKPNTSKQACDVCGDGYQINDGHFPFPFRCGRPPLLM